MKETRVNDRTLILITAACLALSLIFFAPHLWLMRTYMPGTFMWDRAHNFLLQCQDPFRQDIEPALQYRLLPPLVARGLSLPGDTPLALPWLGVVAATGYVAVLFRRRREEWRWVAGGTLLFATTSAVLVPTNFFGLNDAWMWLGLLVVAFGNSIWSTPLACLLCPWIDERFVIGFPLAWLVRQSDANAGWSWKAMLPGLWLAPYACLRLWLSHEHPDAYAKTEDFLKMQLQAVPVMIPMIPLGWWMGLRGAWAGVVYAGWTLRRDLRLVSALVLAGTLVVPVFLASDLSRSVSIILPVVFMGCFEFGRRNPQAAPGVMLGLGILNLVLPAVHVSYTKMDLINPLPIEIIRLFRISPS